MKILITGAKGQLGNEVNFLIPGFFPEAETVLTDCDTLDITDLNAVREKIKGVDAVINCAAFTNVDLCEDETHLANKINSEGVKNLATACNEEDAVLMHVSTDYVFDGENDIPYKETDTPNPVTAYGKSKLMGELEAMKCRKHFILRTSWLYGAVGKNFVKTMIALSETKEFLKVVDDQRGTPTYAKDLAFCMLSLLKTDHYGLYHATGNGNSCTWFEFTKKIFEIKNIKTPVYPCTSEEFNAKAKRPKYSVLENGHLKEVGLDFMRDWETALEEFLTERI